MAQLPASVTNAGGARFMKVKVRRFELDTDEMTAFSTGIPTIPVIYVSLSGDAFAQTFRRCWPEPKVRPLGRTEALRLAMSFKIPGLRERLMSLSPPLLDTIGGICSRP